MKKTSDWESDVDLSSILLLTLVSDDLLMVP